MEELFLAVWAWFCEYGWGFAMLILSGLLVAGILEIMVKKSFVWLAEKWAGHERLIAILNGAKIFVTQLITGLLSVWFAQLVVKAVALPGGEVLLPIWVCCIYFLQYIFSMVGWKGLVAYAQSRKDEKKEPKQPKTKLNLTKTEWPKIYKNEAGELVDKKGNPVKFD